MEFMLPLRVVVLQRVALCYMKDRSAEAACSKAGGAMAGSDIHRARPCVYGVHVYSLLPLLTEEKEYHVLAIYVLTTPVIVRSKTWAAFALFVVLV
jgi:hypothetical protein